MSPTTELAPSGDPDDETRTGGTVLVEADAGQVDEDLLIEEISIDGMCGVY